MALFEYSLGTASLLLHIKFVHFSSSFLPLSSLLTPTVPSCFLFSPFRSFICSRMHNRQNPSCHLICHHRDAQGLRCYSKEPLLYIANDVVFIVFLLVSLKLLSYTHHPFNKACMPAMNTGQIQHAVDLLS